MSCAVVLMASVCAGLAPGKNLRIPRYGVNLVLALHVLSAVATAQASGPRLTVSAVHAFDAGGPLSPIQTVGFSAIRIHYHSPVAASAWSRLDYRIEVTPISVVRDNPLGFAVEAGRGILRWSGTGARTTTYGGGFSPLGLRWRLLPRSRVAPTLHVATGLLVFADPAPAGNAHRLNLTAEAGAGVRVRLGGPWSVDLGVAIHHLSNAGLGGVNPGLDTKAFYADFGVPIGR